MAAASQHPSLPLSHSVSLLMFRVSLSLPRCDLVSLYLGTLLSHSFDQAQFLSLSPSHSAPHAPLGPSGLPLLGLKLRRERRDARDSEAFFISHLCKSLGPLTRFREGRSLGAQVASASQRERDI